MVTGRRPEGLRPVNLRGLELGAVWSPACHEHREQRPESRRKTHNDAAHALSSLLVSTPFTHVGTMSLPQSV